jgi:hypothetical protein
VFLNFVFFIILAKLSGNKSDDGVSHKSLAKIILSKVFNLSLTSFSVLLLNKIFIKSSLDSDLYLLNLYLERIVTSNKSFIFLSVFDNNVKLFGNFLISSPKNSIKVSSSNLLKKYTNKLSKLSFHKKKDSPLFFHSLITFSSLDKIFLSKLNSFNCFKSNTFSSKKTKLEFLTSNRFFFSLIINPYYYKILNIRHI